MINYRKADINDLKIYFHWANDEEVRKNSFNQREITFEAHTKWFDEKIHSDKVHLLVFYLQEPRTPIGQVRFEKISNTVAVIGISLDRVYRGKGFASMMLKMACRDFLQSNPNYEIQAYIKEENTASYYSFLKAGFELIQRINYLGTDTYKFRFK